MSAFTRSRSPGAWTGALLPADLTSLELKARNGLSQRGGAYRGGVTFSTADPDHPITLDKVTVKRGAKAQLAASVTVDLGGSSYPTFSTAVEHKILQPFAPISSPTPEYWNLNFHPTFGGGMQAVALTVRRADASIDDMSFSCPLRTHNGATLSKVTFRFSVPTIRKEDVFRMPRFRVVRVDEDGVLSALKAAGTDELGYTADADGFVEPIASGKAAVWGESEQTVTYLCDQNNAIDTATYTYQIEVEEERFDSRKDMDDALFVYRMGDARFAVDQGDGAVNPTNVPGGAVDGVTAVAEDIALFVPALQANCGLYIVRAGDWPRAQGLSVISDFRERALCFVREGTRNGSTLFQLHYSIRPEPYLFAGAPEIRSPIFVRCPGDSAGNIYHSALLEYAVTSYQPQ